MLSAWLVLAFFAIVVVYAVLERLFRFPARNMSNLVAASRQLRQPDIDELFDPLKEQNLYESLSAASLRKLQQERIHIAFEYERRMAFNVSLIQAVAYTEKERCARLGEKDAQKDELIKGIIELCVMFRIYSLVVLARLAFWIVLGRILPEKRISKLRRVSALDGVTIYERLSQGIATLGGMMNGPDSFRGIMAALGQLVPLSIN